MRRKYKDTVKQIENWLFSFGALGFYIIMSTVKRFYECGYGKSKPRQVHSMPFADRERERALIERDKAVER